MRRVRDLDRIVDSQKQHLQKALRDEEAEVEYNYAAIEAPQSAIPGRKFCSVCGYWGKYSCTRCGMRYCSIRCNNSHKETRCLKFSVM
jgi:zinc finger HIT domain-containing protein 1